MPELPVRDVPTTLVTGSLGVGKTTAILDLFAHRPADGRWAVLVNEFGRVGIDGALMQGDGVAVREVPGGCICCTAGLSLRIGLVRLLREVRPDRLLIEPTGLAHPAAILDALGRPGLREAVSRRATITLVDPRRSLEGPFEADDPFPDQVGVADVLVANRCDGADAARLATWQREAEALFPRKMAIATTTFGKLDPQWLELAPGERAVKRTGHHHDSGEAGEAPPAPGVSTRLASSSGGVATCGWIRPRSEVFERAALEDTLQALVRPGRALPRGALRLKGVFRTPGRWLGVDATAEEVRWRPAAWRSDSRFEVIAPSDPPPQWDLVEAAVLSALWTP